MAQIIKHRRGQLTGVKSLTARNAEFIIASGSISDLQGPFIFIGSPNSTDEGVAGAFKSVSKIYQGTAAPSITAGSYGSILDGTPFYASGNKSLYILNNDGAGGNSRIDLTGNIEGNTISGLTVNNLTGTTGTFSSITGSFTGSFTGDGSNLTGLTADSALTASYVNPLVQDVNISGGLYVTGTGVFEKTQAFTPTNVDIKSAYAAQLRFFVSGSQNGTIYSSNPGELSISANTLKLNNAVANGVFSGSFTGSYIGDGAGLYNIPASGVTGLELNKIIDGAVSASISESNGFKVNTDSEIDGNLNVTGDITGSNLYLSGDAKIDGNITLGGNITIGNQTTDVIQFGGEVSSSILPIANNAFDLGSSSKNWRDLHISGTAFVDTLQARQVNFSDLGILNDLTVSGTTTLYGATTIEDHLTVTEESYFNNNIVVTGSAKVDYLQVTGDANVNTNFVVNGTTTLDGDTLIQSNLEVSGDTLLHDTVVSGSVSVDGDVTAAAFIGDGSQLTGIVSTLYVTGSDGTTTSNGSLNLKTEGLTFSGQSSNGLYTSYNDSTNTVAYSLDQNIKTGATPTFSQLTLSTAGSTTSSAVRADRNLTINGTTNQVSVSGGTQNLQGDRTWTVSLPSTVDLGGGSSITATSGSIANLTSTQVNTTGVTATNGEITNLTSTDVSTTGLTATTASVDLLDATIANIETLSGTTGSFVNMNATDATIGTLITTSGSFTNISANTGSFGRVSTTDLYVSGNLQVLGAATNVTIQSTTVELDDNIIRLNAYSPFERYAGFEVMDSGSSNVSASVLWDSVNDYWMFVSSSGLSSKFVGTTAGTYGSEISLTSGTFPIASAGNTIGDSLLTYSGTTLALNTNKFTVNSSNGDTLVSGNFTLSAAGGADNLTKTSAILFRNSDNLVGYVSTTETTDVLDGILGYKHTGGGLAFSTVIDGGTY